MEADMCYFRLQCNPKFSSDLITIPYELITEVKTGEKEKFIPNYRRS